MATGRPSYNTTHSDPFGVTRSTQVSGRPAWRRVQWMTWLGSSMPQHSATTMPATISRIGRLYGVWRSVYGPVWIWLMQTQSKGVGAPAQVQSVAAMAVVRAKSLVRLPGA